MEPLTIAFIVTGSLFTVSAFYRVGKKAGEKVSDPQNLRRDNQKLKALSALDKTRHEQRSKDLERLTRQRDQYRKIAESHEWSDDPNPVIRQVWKNRRYSDHPETNLRNLNADLQEYADKHIRIQITMTPIGGWKKWFTTWQVDWREGTPERVIEELTTLIRDDDQPLVKEEDFLKTNKYSTTWSKRKAWKDKDSPIRFEVNLSVVEHGPPDQVMEVAVVEEVIVERIVEKHIFLEESEHGPCKHSKEELEAMLEVEDSPESLETRHRRVIEKAKKKRSLESP